MGFIYILIAVLFNATKGYSSKCVSSSLSTLRENFYFNVVRLFVSCLFALAFVLFKGVNDIFTVRVRGIVVCAVAGIAMSIFTCVWQLAIRSKAYMLVSACSSASFIIPALCGLLLWNESFTLARFGAFIFIGFAMYFLLMYDFKLNGKISFQDAVLIILVFITQGVMQCTQKLYAIYVPDKDSSIYTLYMFFFAFCTSLFLLLLFKKNKSEKGILVLHGNVIYMLIMSGSLFATSFFQTLAAKSIDAVILYPILSGLSLVAGSAMSALFFKEKLTRNSVIGITFVFGALVLSRF